MSTLEEMVETACEEYWDAGAKNATWANTPDLVRDRARDGMRAALRAVLEKHVQPMLHGAYSAGFSDGTDDERGKMRLKFSSGSDYAARVIAELTGVTQSQPE